MECSVAIQVLPGVEGEQVLKVVDKVIEHIKSIGLPFSVGPFETTVEGDLDTLMDMVKQCQLICIREGAPQVMSYVKIAYSPQMGVWSIAEKTAKHNIKPLRSLS
ncbi:MAG: thiamine-binding protein [Oscillospiraceae bacterium]|nr:thiamine-binding protein [Oscillospiraceae bacterium]